MSAGEILLLVVGIASVGIGLALLVRGNAARRGLAAWESQAERSSSLLNLDRVERINASRDTPGGRLVDRARVAFFGVWFILAGAIAVGNAVT